MFNPTEALRDNPALFACYVLYVYFRGQNVCRIEREMRALGFTTFHRRNLSPRGRQPGWIAKYWSADTPVRMSVASTRKESAEAETPFNWSADTPVRMSVASTRKESADNLNHSISQDDLAGGTGDADKSVRAPSDWISDLLDELAAFPNGTHDDQIDAISIAVQMASKRSFKSGGALIK